MSYNPQEIEKKWQDYWEKNKFYQAEDFSKKPKKYILIEFPYPSGQGLHVGHTRGYSAMDAIVRKKRMEGFNVLYPIGWDAFGLPAENFAIKTGVHPRITTEKNIANYRRQIKSLGLSFDWSREINTTDPKYYKWTQWIFLQLFKKELAYQAKIPINWCPACKIGLAHEEVVGGKCERCGHKVEQREIKQWMLKITKYADRLIEDLKGLDYLEKIKAQQIEWIGRSEGAEIDFKIKGSSEKIQVFTTRIDTIFGVTAIVIAPEHPLVKTLVKKEKEKEVKDYIKKSKEKTEFERTKLEKEKTGVFTGSYCFNPVNNEEIPVWVGDYVVSTYGGGAVMMVPAHDFRDWEFAKKYKLEVREVISGGNIRKEAFVGYGKLINSGEFNDLSSEKAIKKITEWLEKKKLGKKAIHYKLRDWVFSRQHYWGEPIPIIHCKECGVVAVPEKDLPVELPYIEKYQPTGTGESPLASVKEWVNVKCPKCGKAARRETDTMPNWAGSNWYYMRYCDTKNDKEIADIRKLKYWLPIDWYNGGMEHTTLHLLYSRFIYKFLFDIGVAPAPEPYQKRTSHGIVLAEDNQKMSKSRGNVINPDDIIKQYGADTLRVYEMFMGPYDQTIAWNSKSVNGVFRFLNKIWDYLLNPATGCFCQKAENYKAVFNQDLFKKWVNGEHKVTTPDEIKILLNKTIKKVTEDIENIRFNTAISQLMTLRNSLYKEDYIESKLSVISVQLIDKTDFEKFLILLSPFAPHISEELWFLLGNKKSIFKESWPRYNLKLIKEETTNFIIQVNGKVRDKVEMKTGLSEKEAKALALKSEKVQNWIGNKAIKKIIFVSDKLINFVV